MTLNFCRFASLALTLAIAIAGSARADWMNLTGAENARNVAEIYVEDGQVRLVLEIFVEDIESFQLLLPDDWFTADGAMLTIPCASTMTFRG